ncbi:hypothetical protein PIROE2DRAFT_16639 [Piromyces sp. E2]|nr:hypothetical protein PIROE2DRAFT_16639 [Piromyces sp. E2]|eukprot:OUM58160.1 hypothetical protein PIROE2DRAFT_16639 [Piromyces sp. E2]
MIRTFKKINATLIKFSSVKKKEKKQKLNIHCWVHSNLKDGINTRNERFFDIPFNETVDWKIATGEIKKIKGAHPNIRFKGDKNIEYCKDTYSLTKDEVLEKIFENEDIFIFTHNFIRLWHQYLLNNIKDNNNFQKSWENFVKLFPERPCSCYIQGDAACGKTSVIACFSSFSYWCNGWNYDSYEPRKSFNFFDDYDGASGNGSWESTDFVYLKPWLGCQQVVSISGKYKTPKTIESQTLFPSEDDREYLEQFGLEYIEIPSGNKLWEKPKNNNLENYLEWNWFDTKKTWVYNNLVNPQPEPILEEATISGSNYDIIEISSGPIEPAEVVESLEYDENLFNENSIGRPKRSFGFISDFFDFSFGFYLLFSSIYLLFSGSQPSVLFVILDTTSVYYLVKMDAELMNNATLKDGFAGNRRFFKEFLAKMELIFMVYPDRYSDDESKIVYIISRLYGDAMNWAASLIEIFSVL